MFPFPLFYWGKEREYWPEMGYEKIWPVLKPGLLTEVLYVLYFFILHSHAIAKGDK